MKDTNPQLIGQTRNTKGMPPHFAIMLMGPTAVGKSALALQLAERFPLEIVSVDSAQVYRGMDIGTAKPDPATRAKVAHHLIDLIDPHSSYSAAQFTKDASFAMNRVVDRGKIPLLVGGTMLYFKALWEGLSPLPQADPLIRAELEREAKQKGWPALHAELLSIDPLTAARLKPNDKQRIQRALEVFRLTGRPLSTLQTQRDAADSFRYLPLALVPADRSLLHHKIAQRFTDMLQQGLVNEVVDLRKRYPLHPELPSMRAVGYRQVWQHLEGQFDTATLCEKGIAATRQLAKRQLTWLRATTAQIFDSENPALNEQITSCIHGKLIHRAAS